MSFARKLERHAIVRYRCPSCQKLIIRWKNDTTKLSHETPLCEGFRRLMAEIAKKHGVETYEGASYWAAILDTGEGVTE